MNRFLPLSLLFSLTCISLAAQHSLQKDSVVVDGIVRTFSFNPPSSSSADASVVFVLHGSGGTGERMAVRTPGLIERAKTENVILVFPNAYKGFWNECRKGAMVPANLENIDEIAFFNSMIRYFSDRFGASDKNTFAVGTSGGGHMALKLTLMAPKTFRAVTAIIANLPAEENMDCAPSNVPVSVMIVNGTEDTVNPYNGGDVLAGNFTPGKVRSTDETFRYFADLAGYQGTPSKSVLPDINPADGKIVEKYTFPPKRKKPEVVLLKVVGGKHDYPGDIDVHVEAWEFFKRHRQ